MTPNQDTQRSLSDDMLRRMEIELDHLIYCADKNEIPFDGDGTHELLADIRKARAQLAAPADVSQPAQEQPNTAELYQLREQNLHLASLFDAVKNLIKVKGRHNTEVAYQRLVSAFDAANSDAAQPQAAQPESCCDTACWGCISGEGVCINPATFNAIGDEI